MKSLFVTVAMIVLFGVVRGAEANEAAPNVLIIIADDYGVDVSNTYSDREDIIIPTPVLDSLARRGLVFERAWATPTCSPTRASTMTGRYPFRTGVGGALFEGVTPPEAVLDVNTEFTLAKAVKAGASANYALGHIGKWHVSFGADDPATAGWDHYSGSLTAGLEDYYDWTEITNGVASRNQTYATTDAVNDAVAWISNQEAEGRPWLLWLAFNAPNIPFHVPPLDLHDYDQLEDTPEAIASNSRPYYEAAVQAMDTEIGRLLSSIDLQETYIIFFGDNGTLAPVVRPPFDPTKSKGSLYEGGVRVPFVVTGPTLSGVGQRTRRLVHVVDVFATALDIVRSRPDSVPDEVVLDAISFADLIGVPSRSPSTRRWLFTEQFTSGDFDPSELPPEAQDQLVGSQFGQAVRNARYKLVVQSGTAENPDLERRFFFDLQNDPGENINLLERPWEAPIWQNQYDRLAAILEDMGS